MCHYVAQLQILFKTTSNLILIILSFCRSKLLLRLSLELDIFRDVLRINLCHNQNAKIPLNSATKVAEADFFSFYIFIIVFLKKKLYLCSLF